jgi:hypothetical protein
MNWLHFSFWVCSIYVLYYLILITIDIGMNGRRRADRLGGLQLSFSEDVRPEMISHDEAADASGKRESSMIASGGVSVKDMFGLARKEMIVFTRAVGF